MSGEAMAMKIDLSALIKHHGMRPPRFTPLLLKPATDCECSVQGYASPGTVDREHMKFATLCWTPFKKDIPLLFRHQRDRVAGKLLDVEARYGGLFVRALVTDSEAKRCPYFSIAATIHRYELRQVDDPTAAHALITSATLDEISLVPDNPGHPDAIVESTPAAIEFFNLAIRGIGVIQRQLDIIQQAAVSKPTRVLEQTNQRLHSRPPPQPPVEFPSALAVPYRRGPFGALVTQLERQHPT